MKQEQAKRVVDAIVKLILTIVRYHFFSRTSQGRAGINVARDELMEVLQDANGD